MISQTLSESWGIYKKDLVGWLIFGAVACFIGTIIPVLGLFLILPNIMRETSKAIEQDRAPNLGALFQFEHLKLDLISMGLYLLAQTVGMMMCGIGWLFAWFMFFFTVEIAADARVSASDSLRLSMAWAMHDVGNSVAVMAMGSIILSVTGSLSFGIGAFFAAPFVFIMYAVHWNKIRADVYALAAQKGISVGPETRSSDTNSVDGQL